MSNNELQKFSNEELQTNITMLISENGVKYFERKSIADSIEYSNPTMLDKFCKKEPIRIPASEWKTFVTNDLLGTNKNHNDMVFVHENDLMRIFAKANTPKCDIVESWIFDEVLPSVNNNGGYLAKPMSVNELLELNNQTILRLQQTIEAQKPMVDFANTIASSSDNIDVEEFAKATFVDFGLGRNKMFAKLRDFGFIIPDKTIPYQKWIDQGLFDVVETTKHSVFGDKIFSKTLITPKGQIYLAGKLREEERIKNDNE